MKQTEILASQFHKAWNRPKIGKLAKVLYYYYASFREQN